MSDANWLQVVGTAFLGLVGLWLAHNYRRQIRLKLAERQVDAYKELWTMTAVASPERATPLDHAERQKLRDEINRWYFDDGNGILMSTPGRDLLIAFQSNLTCPTDSVKPQSLANELATLPDDAAERRRGCTCIRQASLLRTQLKADLNLHVGVNYYTGLRQVDRDFLVSCGVSPRRRPWRRRSWAGRGRIPRPLRSPRSYITDLCVCGTCFC
jgi:hypothetical protein